jgi:hypothetical protein
MTRRRISWRPIAADVERRLWYGHSSIVGRSGLLPTVFPPMSQTAGLLRLWVESQFSGIRKVMVMRVFVAGGTGVMGRRPPRATQEGATK